MRWRERLVPFVIVLLGMLAYLNSFSNTFILDDFHAIVKHPGIGQLVPFDIRTRWLTDLTFRLNYAIGGLNVVDYHAVNLIFHIAAGLCLYGVIRRTLRLPRFGSESAERATIVAGVCAVLWTLHPLQTQSVTYICQRYESMFGLFALLTLYAFIRGVESSKKERWWFNLSILFCLLGMGTKGIMIVVPVLILLYDFCFVAERARDIPARRWRVYTALFLTWGMFGMYWLSTQGVALADGAGDLGAGGVAQITPLVYLRSQCGVILRYLQLGLFPRGLCLDYAWPLPPDSLEAWVPMGIMGVLGGVILYALWRRRVEGFLGAAFFLILAPTSSFVSLPDLAVEHRMYLSLAALVVLVVLAIEAAGRILVRRRIMSKRLVVGLGGCLVSVALAGLMVGTIQRNTVYASEESVWRDVCGKRPGNFRAHFNLVSCVLGAGRFAEAEEMARAVRLRMVSMIETGQVDRRIPACDPQAYYAHLCDRLGMSLLCQGKNEGAIAALQEAIRVEPGNSTAHSSLGLAWLWEEKTLLALKEFEASIRLDPGNGRVHVLKGQAHVKEEQYVEARNAYERAVVLTPGLMPARIELAWLLATCPDEDVRDASRAQKLARAVCVATGYGSARALDALAAAEASAGSFPEARALAARALSLAEVLDQEPGRNGAGDRLSDAIRARMALYEQDSAYRMESGEK